MKTFFGIVSGLLIPCSLIAAPKVSLVTDAEPGRATRHGIEQLEHALQAKGIALEKTHEPGCASGNFIIVAGLAGGKSAVPNLMTELNCPPLTNAESLAIRKTYRDGKSLVLVAGSDDRGLMYALLDVADRVGGSDNAGQPFSAVHDITEQADVPDRALSIYTFQRAAFEQRFFDEAYWTRYFDMLARDRYNSFVLIFGYENGGYFAPAYPWFFNVDNFPDIAVPNVTKEQQERYLRALNRLVEMAHDRGLRFNIGLWDQIYVGGVQSGGLTNADPKVPGPDRVWGLNHTNLLDYSRAGLAKFLQLVPGIDGIQFRMHDEGGLKPGEEQHAFWKVIFETVKQQRPALPLTLRAKGLPDDIIALGLDMGLNIRVATKYWMEQVGMPFHPTHIVAQDQMNRRHGYADLLRYPQRYKMHWRLWTAGTIRILLWGDPEFARRFAESTHLYDGDGFEVTEPLGTKMQGQPHDSKPFDLLKPQYRYTDYEFERYWHFYQVFGRMAYNPKTPADVFDHEFTRRFGPDAGPFAEKALHQASWILPRINASVFPYRNFPTTRGWAEKQRWGDLAEYAKEAAGSDIAQFEGIDEAARNLLDGVESAKVSPYENSAWFSEVSQDVLDNVREAEQRIGGNRSKEFDSTMVDLKMLAHLAGYHAHRIHAGMAYALFTRSQHLRALDVAIDQERAAIAEWDALVKAAGDVYADDLLMGRRSVDLCGHWRDELVALRKDLSAIEKSRQRFKPASVPELTITQVPVRKAPPNEDLIVRATIWGPDPVRSASLLWETGDGRPSEISMNATGPFIYSATVPRSKVRGAAHYSIVAEDAVGRHAAFPSGSSYVDVIVSDDNAPPELKHVPIKIARSGEALRVTATVRDSSGIKWARLRYRGVTQFEDYDTLPMRPTGKPDEYEAIVPGDKILAKWDFMYFFEVMDNAGNGKIYPDLGKETPYVVVKLRR